jgi:hypothetical protein
MEDNVLEKNNICILPPQQSTLNVVNFNEDKKDFVGEFGFFCV